MPLMKEVPFVALICMAQLLTQAGLGQAIAPLHIMAESFGIKNPAELSWVPASYSLTVGTFILPAGRMGDIFGHRKMFIIGFVWYGLWSLLAGISVYSDQIFFDICRAFQGIGPAILLPNALAILGTTYPPGKRKNMIFSLFGATAPGGFTLGACFSSLFGQLAWWPWAYWTMAIVCVFFGISAVFILPKRSQTRLPLTFAMFDPYGTILGVCGLVLVNFAWNQGAAAGWIIVYTYVLLIVGVGLLVAFIFAEIYASHPLIPLKHLSTEVLYVLACMAAGWSSFGIWVFYFWQILEELRNYTPLLATACFVPGAISGFCAAITTGFVLHKTGPSVVMLISMTAFTVGIVLTATSPVKQIYWTQTFFSVLVMPWGMDMSFPSSTILLSQAMPREHQGAAASIINTVVNYSISLGLGFAGTVESNINGGGTKLLRGYRGALYMGIGFAGLGVLTSITFIISRRLPAMSKEANRKS